MTFSEGVVKELLIGSTKQRLELEDVYEQLPPTRCRRRTDCCSLLPEMNLLEALAAIQLLVNMTVARRKQLNKSLIRYFLLNPAEISFCPFLDKKDCVIYEDRFFGCRAYGLWSPQHYEEQAARSRQAKRLSQTQWRELGIELPQEVINFHLSYCPYVELERDVQVDEKAILDSLGAIEGLSTQLSPWHDTFRQEYFSDLSFLLASLALGRQRAIQLKFEIVRDALTNGKKERLAKILEMLPDIGARLL